MQLVSALVILSGTQSPLNAVIVQLVLVVPAVNSGIKLLLPAVIVELMFAELVLPLGTQLLLLAALQLLLLALAAQLSTTLILQPAVLLP